jgi:hypothetical protein
LFQLFNYKDTLPTVLNGFDEDKAGTTERLTRLLRKAYDSISSRSQSQNQGSRTTGNKSRGGHSQKLDTIQEHQLALMLVGYKIVAPMKDVMSLPFAVNWG